MITELHIKDPEKTPISWWSKIEALKGRDKFEFRKTGLTILWGPNGVGKSSVLKMLACLTHCMQGGIPALTRQSIENWKEGASIKTDGKPVHFLDPITEVGLIGGQLDGDFTLEGIQSVFMRKLSSGQQTTAKFNRIIESAATLKEVPSKIKAVRENPETTYEKKVHQARQYLQANLEEEGPPTVLLDEPCHSFSISRQIELWNLLARQERFQVIVATHSVFAMNLDAQYIDLQPGYLEKSRKTFKAFFSSTTN